MKKKAIDRERKRNRWWDSQKRQVTEIEEERDSVRGRQKTKKE